MTYKKSSMQVSWTPPEPRSGLLKQWDTFIGPGATTAELWLILMPAFLFAIFVPYTAKMNNLGWTTTQMIIAALLAGDIIGGVITNATATAKRWYHRPGQGFKEHLLFTAVHVAQLFFVGWFFRDGDWSYIFVTYGYLIIAGISILKTPHYLQRPVACLFFMGGLFIHIYGFPPTAGMAWFLPAFYLKLLISHLLKEAPFTPK